MPQNNKDNNMNYKKKLALRIIVISGITLGIFYVIFTKIDIYLVITAISHANTQHLLVSILFTPLFPIIGAKRWQYILRSVNCRISYKKSFYSYMSAIPLANITPSNIGDFIKGFYLRDEINVSIPIGGVLTEKILDLSILVSLIIFASIFYPVRESSTVILIILLLLILTILTILTIRWANIKYPRNIWSDKISDILLSLRSLTKDLKAFLVLICFTFIFWILSIIQTIIFFYSLGIDIPYTAAVAGIPMAILIGLLPITVAGMGTRDSAFILLFTGYASAEKILGVGILFSLIRKWLLIILCLPFTKKMLQKTWGQK